MTFTVTILGNNAALPAQGRHPSAQAVNFNEEFYLLDCGEDTQSRIRENKIKLGRLDFIFISHLHGDHFFGLIGLITSLHLNRRSKTLTVFGPEGLTEIIMLQLKYSNTQLVYPIEFVVVNTTISEKIFDSNLLEVYTIPLQHRIPCCGYLFKEKFGLRRINVEATTQNEIPFSLYNDIKDGKDYIKPDGKVIANEDLTYGPNPKRSYAFCSDTIFTDSYIDVIRNADLIYHEATFLNVDETRAAERFHCTAKQAAMIAQKANAKKLLLGHFSSKYSSIELFQDEAREVFPTTIASEEGKTYEVEYCKS